MKGQVKNLFWSIKNSGEVHVGIKHDFLCINICWGPREVLKRETERKNTLPANVSRAKTNFTVTVHFTYDDVSFYDGPVTRLNSRALIALLIHGFVLVKTWLWTASGTVFNAFLHCYMTEEKSVSWLVQFSWIIFLCQPENRIKLVLRKY